MCAHIFVCLWYARDSLQDAFLYTSMCVVCGRWAAQACIYFLLVAKRFSTAFGTSRKPLKNKKLTLISMQGAVAAYSQGLKWVHAFECAVAYACYVAVAEIPATSSISALQCVSTGVHVFNLCMYAWMCLQVAYACMHECVHDLQNAAVSVTQN
jgi:hypothetical protein